MILSKRWIIAVASLFFFWGATWAQGTMTDEQVLEYAQQGAAEGKSRDELVSELALRGVTRAQAERVYALYQSRQNTNQAAAAANDVSRVHSVNGNVTDEAQVSAFVSDKPIVYGRNIFRDRGLNFSPSENLATPTPKTVEETLTFWSKSSTEPLGIHLQGLSGKRTVCCPETGPYLGPLPGRVQLQGWSGLHWHSRDRKSVV